MASFDQKTLLILLILKVFQFLHYLISILEMGADIVVTGRTADSALALAPCVHEFEWSLKQDFDLLCK